MMSSRDKGFVCSPKSPYQFWGSRSLLFSRGKADHSSRSSVKVRNCWSCSSNVPGLMTCTGTTLLILYLYLIMFLK